MTREGTKQRAGVVVMWCWRVLGSTTHLDGQHLIAEWALDVLTTALKVKCHVMCTVKCVRVSSPQSYLTCRVESENKLDQK